MILPATKQFKSTNTIIDNLKLGKPFYAVAHDVFTDTYKRGEHELRLSFTDGVFVLVVDNDKRILVKVFVCNGYLLVVNTEGNYCSYHQVLFSQITFNL